MASPGIRDARIGTVLKGKWTIESRIGRGGVGTVYAARHRQGARIAIKILNREVAQNADVRARFLREGYAANTVDHPGVVRVFDDDTTEDGMPFLVMDLLEGELADEKRRRLGGRLPLPEVLKIGDRVLDVLAAAHDKGIIHRDIKPENIFLCADGSVRVLDFGAARIREATRAMEVTHAGVLLGTPEFMSPEQANGVPAEVDSLTDIWATGATLFTMLSGEPVHEAETLPQQIFATVSERARSLASVAPTVAREIVDIVDRALAYEKRDRWQDARAMQRALASAFDIAGVPRVLGDDEDDGDPTVAMERPSLPHAPSRPPALALPVAAPHAPAQDLPETLARTSSAAPAPRLLSSPSHDERAPALGVLRAKTYEWASALEDAWVARPPWTLKAVALGAALLLFWVLLLIAIRLS